MDAEKILIKKDFIESILNYIESPPNSSEVIKSIINKDYYFTNGEMTELYEAQRSNKIVQEVIILNCETNPQIVEEAFNYNNLSILTMYISVGVRLNEELLKKKINNKELNFHLSHIYKIATTNSNEAHFLLYILNQNPELVDKAINEANSDIIKLLWKIDFPLSKQQEEKISNNPLLKEKLNIKPEIDQYGDQEKKLLIEKLMNGQDFSSLKADIQIKLEKGDFKLNNSEMSNIFMMNQDNPDIINIIQKNCEKNYHYVEDALATGNKSLIDMHKKCNTIK